MATVREKKPGVWEVRVFTGRDAAGRPTQVSRTVRGGKRDALHVAAQLEAKPPAAPARRLVADALNAWVEASDPTWAVSTRRDQRSRVALIASDSIARVPLARISVADVERWHLSLRSSGIGEAAIVNRHSVLRAALEFAVRWEWLSVNVAAKARLKQRKQAGREAMSAEEMRAVLDAARSIGPAAELVVRLAAVTGARRAELAALRWDDLEGTRLRIDSQVITQRSDDHLGAPEYTDGETKTANRRLVHLDEQTIELFVAERDRRGECSPYVFGDDALPPSPARVSGWWERSRKLSGVDRSWRLHDLRHWSATTAISHGHDVRTVAGRLGHADAAMTLRAYAHALEAPDRDVADGLADALDYATNDRGL
ncbi:MAG: site-specific integrase [Acidimicrobiia bacterium]|nr:site-specific integrase [Acidimicrobiia bacterium]